MKNVELVKEGKLAIDNDGVDEIKKCCKFIWPENLELNETANFYIGYKPYGYWCGLDEKPNIPTIKATELLKEIEGVETGYKRGDLVEVSDDGEEWYKRIFISELKGTYRPFYCVLDSANELFLSGRLFDCMNWKHIRHIEPTVITYQEIADKFGIKLGAFTVKEK